MEDQDDTRGMSQREILLEVRSDVKDVKEEQSDVRVELVRQQVTISAAPTVKQILAFAAAYSTILISLHALGVF